MKVEIEKVKGEATVTAKFTKGEKDSGDGIRLTKARAEKLYGLLLTASRTEEYKVSVEL